MEMIDAVIDAFVQPFMSSVGWQAFFMGLLGLKSLRKVKDFVQEMAGDDTKDEDESKE